MATDEKTTALLTWNTLDGDRSSTIDRAMDASEVTVPYLFREDTSKAQDDYDYNYVQGYGAKLVNHLVGKFALSILPPSQPFYRLSATNEAMEAVSGGDANAKFEIEKILAQQEDGILRYINNSGFRAILYPALRLACVTGDSLIEKTSEDKFRVFNMHNYVIKRDAFGNILKLVIKEVLAYESVPEDIRSSISEDKKDEPVDLYTKCELIDGKYELFQEINEEIVTGSEETLKSFNDRFISVRWTKMYDEDYGRGFVEDHIETFKDLDNQLRVLSQSAAISSKSVFTVNPNGMTKYSDYVDAVNGDVIIGLPTDIGVVRVDKQQDLNTTYSLVNDYKRELAESFLMSSSSIRNAERVTAHEVQMVAAELEASFGGVYTAISQDIQMPLVINAMNSLNIEAGKDVDVIITTGVEALGRNVEMSKINGMIQELLVASQLVGQEAIAASLSADNIVGAIIANSGVASKNFLISQMEKDQASAAQEQKQMMDMVAQGGLPQMGANMANQVELPQE